MAGNQVAVILDAHLPLDDGEAQVSQNGGQGTEEAIEDPVPVDYVKAKGLIQNQAVQLHKPDGAQDTAHGALHSLVGADHRSQLVLAQGSSHKIGSGVRRKGDDKGDENIILPQVVLGRVRPGVHGPDADQSRQQVRKQQPGGQAQADFLKAQLGVGQKHLPKEKHQVEENAQGCQIPVLTEAPEGDQHRHHHGIGHQPEILHQTRPVKQLIGGNGSRRAEQRSRGPGGKHQDNHQQQGQQGHCGKHSCFHVYLAPPNRRLRRWNWEIASSRSLGPKSGHRTSINTYSE